MQEQNTDEITTGNYINKLPPVLPEVQAGNRRERPTIKYISYQRTKRNGAKSKGANR
jgi:hypothetical protein